MSRYLLTKSPIFLTNRTRRPGTIFDFNVGFINVYFVLQVASAYKQFMKDVTLKLNAISTDARTFSEDMFGFEKRIAEIMPDSIHPLNITVYNKRITVGKLKEIAAMVINNDRITFLSSKLFI